MQRYTNHESPIRGNIRYKKLSVVSDIYKKETNFFRKYLLKETGSFELCNCYVEDVAAKTKRYLIELQKLYS